MKDIFSKQPDWKKVLPYALIIAVFAIITLIYVSPVLEGKKILQPDIVKFDGMAKEIRDFRSETGEEALWTNSMFGGMPAVQISVEYPNNISGFLHDVMTLWLPRPADMIFLYFIGFFIFMLMLKVNIWVSFFGAVAFALSSYNFIIIDAGHNSKAVAIAYMAPVLGSIIYTFRGKLLAGGLLFTIFLSLQIWANHFQITYYLLIIVIFYGIFELIERIRTKQIDAFLKASGVLLLAALIAVGVNISRLWFTYEYTEATMRGGTELAETKEEKRSGLDIEYITAWSYGVGESFSFLVPNVKGGSTQLIGDNPTAMKNVDRQFRNEIANSNQYWGDQPFTSGPVYLGAIVMFLFVLSLFYVKGTLKYALLTATILSIMLAWGKNFMPFTEFFVNNIPGYDKFRAVSMTLTIAALCIPALAALGLAKIVQNPDIFSYKNRNFYIAFGLTGGLALLFYLLPGTFFSFLSEQESSMLANQKASMPEYADQISIYAKNLENARIGIFRADAIRSFIFIALAAAFILAFSLKRFSQKVFVMGIAALVLIDMVTINRRYLNDDNFEVRRRVERPYERTQADEIILKDTDVGFRVLDLTESTFNSTRTSYFHMSIGGYHGAKLQRYQDLIDNYFVYDIHDIRQSGTIEEIYDILIDAPVLNMLNTRYIIYHPEAMPIINTYAIGNAWFVQEFAFAEKAIEELEMIGAVNPETTAVVAREFADFVADKNLGFDRNANIELQDYQPNRLVYKYKSDAPALAVFSEIFYPKGWQAYINEEPVDHFRVNYILRAMVVPEGENEIVFEYKPKSYYTGENIALIFSIIIVLLVLGYIGFEGYKRFGKKAEKPNEA